jgi:hypothetical protein
MQGMGSLPTMSAPLPSLTDATARHRWWWLLPPLTLLGAGWLAHGQSTWDLMLATAAHVLFVGALALAIVGITTTATRLRWRAMLPPLAFAIFLVLVGIALTILAPTALLMQAHAAENQGDYAHAAMLYQHAGQTNDMARAQLEWGQALVNQHDFTNAQTHIQAALDTSQGALHDEARVAIGQLFWAWGQALQASNDLTDTRLKWEAAAMLAAGTTDGDRAATALSTPQEVTGRVLAKGIPQSGLQVALVTAWTITPTGMFKTSGTRLTATSAQDGSFTIANVRPNVLYTFIWVGASGDMTAFTGQGQPLYTILVLPLQGGDLGTISVSSIPTLGNHGNGAT